MMASLAERIPCNILARIAAFLVAGQYGEIVLHVQNGRVTRMVVTESVVADAGDKAA